MIPQRRVLLLSGGLLLLGCGSEVGGFAGTRALVSCTGNYPVCNTNAGCVLEESQFIDGTLPGARQIIFRTDTPALVRVRLLLLEQRSPGRDTRLEWNELGCASQQVYSTMGQDLFQLAGDRQQVAVERSLTTPGDHLIRLTSDATCRYQLRVEVAR